MIVATWEPHQDTVLDVIHDLGLELQVIFNKGAVMVLPSGVNKAVGLEVALAELGLSAHNTVGIGDAENDHAFLAHCECAVAVENALPTLKERADWVTENARGAGVTELIERLDADDLRSLEPNLRRHDILLGQRDDGREERFPPQGLNILIAGTSGSGKSSKTTGLLERLDEPGYQFCVIDPEGDYTSLDFAVVLGDPHHEPGADEVLELLEKPEGQNAVVNLLSLDLSGRPPFFDDLLPKLQHLRARTGRPHWIVVDEAHHLMPKSWDPTELTLPHELTGTILITVHPGSVSKAMLEAVDLILAVGEEPEKTIRDFCEAVGRTPPEWEPVALEKKKQALVWWTKREEGPFRVETIPPRTERTRHSRKYAEGNLGPERSFYFRGPQQDMKLRAQNLVLFLQLAEGVDDETWQYHLERGDYSNWFRNGIKDDDLAAEAEAVERRKDAKPAETRAQIREIIEERYTLPSEPEASATDPSKRA